jgi:hypothetical protein
MSTGGLWFQWARTISIHYYLDIGLLINKVSLWTAWWYGKFIWSTQSRLNEERCEFLHKIGIRNNEINARNFFFLINCFDIASVESMFGYDGWLSRVLVNSNKSIKKTPLMLWVPKSSRAMCTTLCNKVCQWLATSLVVFSGYSDVIHHTTTRYNWNIVESGVSHLY